MPKCFIRNAKTGERPKMDDPVMMHNHMHAILHEQILSAQQQDRRKRKTAPIAFIKTEKDDMQQRQPVAKKQKIAVPTERPEIRVTKIKPDKNGHELYERGKYRCMWDTYDFEGVPVRIPVHYSPKTNSFKPSRYVFCSPNCAKSHLLNKGGGNRNEKSEWFRHYMRQRYGITYNRRILPAPGREALKIYGGKYDIDEFRRLSSTGVMTIIGGERDVLEYVQIGEMDCKSAQAHVEWIRQQQQPSEDRKLSVKRPTNLFVRSSSVK